MSHHVPGPPDYDVVMTEQVPGLNGPKMLGRHKPTAPYQLDFLDAIASVGLHITPRNGLYTSRNSIICVILFDDGISPS